MTKAEAVVFVNSIAPATVSMVTIDAAKWTAFKALVVPILSDSTLDPKFKAALAAANIKIDEANAIVDGALG